MLNKKILLIISVFLFTAAALAIGAFFYIEAQVQKPLEKAGLYGNFEISSGESAKQIGESLAREGLIGDPFIFKYYLWKTRLKSSIKAGEYNLSPAMNIPKIVEIITKGETIGREITVLIPEGLTSAEIEKILVEKELVKENEFQKAVREKNKEKYYNYDFLENSPGNSNLEGYLFPDTYKFYKKTAPENILEKMLDNFGKKIDLEIREEIARQGKTVFEALTLASIVQKEANGAEDMEIISGIFQNRLAIGKPLESDATINFISGKKMRQPLFSDLELNSPYNTYKNPGLPPGPISNPGLDAIRAVIWPEKNNYLYFLHTLEGKAIFSKTYEEHLRNKAKYLK